MYERKEKEKEEKERELLKPTQIIKHLVKVSADTNTHIHTQPKYYTLLW